MKIQINNNSVTKHNEDNTIIYSLLLTILSIDKWLSYILINICMLINKKVNIANKNGPKSYKIIMKSLIVSNKLLKI